MKSVLTAGQTSTVGLAVRSIGAPPAVNSGLVQVRTLNGRYP